MPENRIYLSSSQYYTIIQEFGLEGTFKCHLVKPLAISRNIFNQVFRDLSNMELNVSRNGALTTFLDMCMWVVLSPK